MLTSKVRKHSNELWRMGRVVLSVTGDVTVLKIIKSMRQAHYDIDKTRWHAQQIWPRSPFSTGRNQNTFVLLCSSMCKSKCQIHHITGQREITANEILHTHTQWLSSGGCLYVQQGTHGEVKQTHLWQTCRRGNWSVCQPRLYFHLCSDYNFHSWSEGTTVDVNWQKRVSNRVFDVIFM